ncbi:hypothetical protein EMCRGX_G034664 [Ephydatia muelleri]
MARIMSANGVDKATLDNVIKESCATLRSGGVIAVPTETVYGISASVASNEGVQKIYAIKGRQKDKPVAICLSDVSQIEKWCRQTVSVELLGDLLPGPVTVVFERSEALNPALNPGVSLVGVRVPDYPLLRSLVAAFGEPLALTSANISNTRSTLAIEEFEELWPQLDLVIDGGRISEVETEDSRKGSTVVNLSIPGTFSIIRKGCHYEETVKLLREKYHFSEA